MVASPRARWWAIAASLVTSVLVLATSARAGGLDREDVGVYAMILVYGAVAALMAALFNDTVFRIVAGLAVLVLLYLVLWGAWRVLPMALLLALALFTPRPPRDRRAGGHRHMRVGPGGARDGGRRAGRARGPARPVGLLRPGGPEQRHQRRIQRSLGSGGPDHELQPGVRSISVRMEGVRVEISPYVDEAGLADIRRDMATSPGVVSVREGKPCG